MTDGIELVGYVVGGAIAAVFVVSKLTGKFFLKSKSNSNNHQLDRLVKLNEDQLNVMLDIRTSLAVMHEQHRSMQCQLDKLRKEVV